MAKIVVDVTIPELPEGKDSWNVGDVFTVEVETPKREGRPRGQLAGIDIVDMTDEQLKIEIINSKSVLYKAKQRGASPETIQRSQERVDRALAERSARQGTNVYAEAEAVTDEETASEV